MLTSYNFIAARLKSASALTRDGIEREFKRLEEIAAPPGIERNQRNGRYLSVNVRGITWLTVESQPESTSRGPYLQRFPEKMRGDAAAGPSDIGEFVS